MRISDALRLRPGDCVAVVGTGGKTALVERLADENAAGGVLMAPTTRMGLGQVRERPGVRYLGRVEGEKLVAAPLEEIKAASQGYGLTLMEADGSKGLPLKGWASHEPVVPPFATLTLGVIPVQALGMVVQESRVHRLPLFLAQTGLRMGDVVDAKALSRMIAWCMDRYGVGRKAILINQVDHEAQVAAAREIAQELKNCGGQVLMGSAREGILWNES